MQLFQNSFLISIVVAGLLIALGFAGPVDPRQAEPAFAESGYGFEQNLGQLDQRVRFLLRGPSYHAFIQPDSIVYTWFQRTGPDSAGPFARPRWTREATIRMTLEGADPRAKVEGAGEATRARTYLGSECGQPAGLRPPHFERVVARSVYEGVDVEYYLSGSQLEHDFVVAPGADPSPIRLRFDGIDSLKLSPGGDLLLVSGEHTLVQQAPLVYQGSRENPEVVSASYRVEDDGGVAYEIASYDASRPLVIDPIAWTTYAGGAGVEFLVDAAAGLFGEAALLIFSTSADFPVTEQGQLVRAEQNTNGPRAVVRKIRRRRRVRPAKVVPRFRSQDAVLSRQSDNLIKVRLVDRSAAPPLDQLPPIAIVSGSIPSESNRQQAYLTGVVFHDDGSATQAFEWSGGSEFNDALSEVRAFPDFDTGAIELIKTGSAGGAWNGGFQPLNGFNGGGDPMVATSTLMPDGDTYTLNPGTIRYFGGPEFGSINAADGFVGDDGVVDFVGVFEESGAAGAPRQVFRIRYGTTGELQAPQFTTVDFPGRVTELKVHDHAAYFGGSIPNGGGLFVGAGVFNGVGVSDLQFETIELSGSGSLGGIGINPGFADELLAVFGDECDAPNGDATASPVSIFGGLDDGLPAPCAQQTVRRFDGLTRFLTAGAARKLDSFAKRQGAPASRTTLGPGRGVVFDSILGGSYVLGGLTSAEVFGAVNGVELPEPLDGLPANGGPGDVFAMGGMLDADWVITITGPASFEQEPLARGGIGTAFSPGFAPGGQSASAPAVPLPNNLLGAEAVLVDAAGVEWPLGQFFLNSNQMNFHVPPEAALGLARIEVNTAAGAFKVGETLIVEDSPNAFVFGGGLGAALTIHIAADGTRTDTSTIAEPEISVSDGDTLVFSQFVTGTSAGGTFSVECDGQPMSVLGAAPAAGLLGVEQVAFQLDFEALAGAAAQRKTCNVEVDGALSNDFDVQYNWVR